MASSENLTPAEEANLLALMDAQYPTHESVARQRAEAAAGPTGETFTIPGHNAVDWGDITATRLDTGNPDNPGLLGLSTSQRKWIALPAGVDVPEHLRDGYTPKSQTEHAQRVVSQLRAYPVVAGASHPAPMSDEALTAEMDRLFPPASSTIVGPSVGASEVLRRVTR